MVADLTRLAQRFEDPTSGLLDLGLGDVVADDHKLVTAEPGERVVGPEYGSDADGRLHQQVVTAAVTEGVVDQLEPVQVQKHHGELGLA